MTQGYDESGTALTACMLPALCYGAGNALTYTTCFEDNYGAGRRICYQKKDDFFALEEDVRYTDLFGRIKTMSLSIAGTIHSDTRSTLVAQLLPKNIIEHKKESVFYAKTGESNRLIIDKDSRECIKSLTYQISFLEADGVKISPFFAENLPFSDVTRNNLVVIPLKAPVNNLTEYLIAKDGQKVLTASRNKDDSCIDVSCTMNGDGVGWAVAAYNENDIIDGWFRCHFLFGKNEPVKKGDTISFYLTFFRKNNISEVKA